MNEEERKQHDRYMKAVKVSMDQLVLYAAVCDELNEQGEQEGKQIDLNTSAKVRQWSLDAATALDLATTDGMHKMPEEVKDDHKNMQFTFLGILMDFFCHYCTAAVLDEVIPSFMPQLSTRADLAKGIQASITKIGEQAGFKAEVKIVEVDPKTDALRPKDDEEDPFKDIPEIADGDTVCIDSRKEN